MENSKIIGILVIEDNSEEITLIANAMDITGWNITFNSVKDGIEAMNYLYKKGKYKNCETPSLILLDLNLPKKSGFEVLEEIKTDNILKYIPVIVLTNSNEDNDVIKSYDLHANAYIIKPADYNEFTKYMHTFKEFWLNAQLPQGLI